MFGITGYLCDPENYAFCSQNVFFTLRRVANNYRIMRMRLNMYMRMRIYEQAYRKRLVIGLRGEWRV